MPNSYLAFQRSLSFVQRALLQGGMTCLSLTLLSNVVFHLCIVALTLLVSQLGKQIVGINHKGNS